VGQPSDPDYGWSAIFYGEKGMLKASTMRADFIPMARGKPIHFDCLFEREKFPEDVGEPDIELNAAPATRQHMKNWLEAIENRGRPSPTSRRATPPPPPASWPTSPRSSTAVRFSTIP